MTDWIYDIETFPNCFTLIIGSTETSESHIFEISDRRDDSLAMRRFLGRLYKNKDRMVGFNNVGFDYPVVHEFLRGKNVGYEDLYQKAMDIIDSFKDDRFKHRVRPNKVFIEQVDLFLIHHFDNGARSTSLKMLEFNMRSNNIEDLPFPVGTELTDAQKDVLVEYNKHDVLETLKFYKETLGAIRMREELSEKYGRNFINHNDTKIGKDYFVMQLEKAMPGCCYDYTGGQRRINQTKRDIIDLNEAVFPWIEFKRPEFRAAIDWFRAKQITETKGVMSNILESELRDVAKYAELTTKRQRYPFKPGEEAIAKFKSEKPKGWIEEKELKSKKGAKSYWKHWNVADNLNVVVDGFRFDFGTGGIHGSIESSVVESDDEWVIIDLDVASYYPNLAIANRLHPAHLGEVFCDIYEDVYNQRKGYAKGTPENAVMKLALNGVYGDSNSRFSPFYDPLYTMSITINGQLLLCLLAERLMEIEDLMMVQVNTDGLTVRVKREFKDQVDRIAQEWEEQTGLELEEAVYSRMFIRDVNNYIAEYAPDKEGVRKLKRKGAYEYDDLGWHQNHSALVIKKAAERALIHGGDIEDFIMNHTDKFDFMLRTKVPRTSRLVTENSDCEETQQQNICRYYIAKTDDKLVKIMPPLKGKVEERRIGIDKEWNIKIANDITCFKWDIDYEYYISEAEKLVNPLM